VGILYYYLRGHKEARFQASEFHAFQKTHRLQNAPTGQGEELKDDEAFNKLIRFENPRALRNIIIGEVVLSAVWGVLGGVIPSGGTLMAVMNITFFLLSTFLGWAMAMVLRLRFSLFISAFLAAVVWALVFGVLRGFL